MAEFPFKSLRDWIEFLEKKDRLVRNKEELDLRLEGNAISRRIVETNGPAVLHENVKGYPGWRLFSDGLTTYERQSWVFDMDFREALSQIPKRKPIKPVEVATGPCKEIKVLGDDVDLVKLPLPHMLMDVPPYITAGISVMRDPETGWTNLAILRFQLQGKNKMTCLVQRGQHTTMIYMKYMKEGKPTPVSLVIGPDPHFYAGALLPAPEQVDEWDTWGAITGQPLEVVKSETSDILVPATAELVVEAEISPDERMLEGPFNEYTGFFSGCRWCPVMTIKAITMRKDPIFQHLFYGKEPNEGNNFAHPLVESAMIAQLRDSVPEVKDVAIISCFANTTAVAIDKEARKHRTGLVMRVAMALKSIKAGAWVKNVFIVDDDINVHSLEDIMWAFSTKFQGGKDITVIKDIPGFDLDPSELSLGLGPGHSSYTILDCTEPLAPYNEAYKRGVAVPPAYMMEKVKSKWQQYGFK